LHESIRSLAAWRPQREEAGQGLAEYALILGLIAVVAILSLVFLGDTIANLMSYIGDTIDQST
jgi:Flp pilus assembly pilin Flp